MNKKVTIRRLKRVKSSFDNYKNYSIHDIQLNQGDKSALQENLECSEEVEPKSRNLKCGSSKIAYSVKENNKLKYTRHISNSTNGSSNLLKFKSSLKLPIKSF